MSQKNISKFIDSQLNDAQKEAVLHTTGPLQVIAGAGSGKTRVITSRIVHLMLNHFVPPHCIVALTFTNKASKEMKERIAKFLDDKYTLPFVGTFHAFCVQILKKNQDLLAAPFFSILDSDDQEKMVKGILQRANLHKQYSAKNVVYTISKMKNATKNPDNPDLNLLGHPIVQDVYSAYEQEKLASKCYDFDDIILETVKLFKTNDQFKKNFQSRVRHILVDEYQDTNVIQHELLRQMGLYDNTIAVDSVCVVGDEDQSIYSWRGATVENMLHFKKDFSGTTTIKIEQNYRSAKSVLEIANAIIKNNRQRTPKILRATKKSKSKPLGLQLMSSYQEASVISHLIIHIKQHKPGTSIALLYRTHAQSRTLEESLIKESIAYKIIGGVQFYDRKEIKDLIAYLKLIANPFDRTSFFRIINIPSRGLGAKFEDQVYNIWQDQPFLTFQDVLQKLIDNETLKGNKKAAVENFISIFNGLTPTTISSNALQQVILRTQYLRYIKDAYEVDAQTRIENIQELENAMKHFASHGTDMVEKFLHEVALLQDKLAHQQTSSDAVLLMTLHAAKGLEFDTVILPGLEDGILPTQRSTYNSNAIEEERRLFYVGITRARENLVITYTKHRYAYGQMIDQIPSRFLSEIPSDLLEFVDCTYWQQYEFSALFKQWLTNTLETIPVKSNAYKPSNTTRLRPTVFAKATPVKSYGGQATKTKSKKQTFAIGEDAKKTIWKVNQPVKHKKYGIGLIKKIEKKGASDTHLTILFNGQEKKISAKFVQMV